MEIQILRRWLAALLEVRDTPEALARGLAVGFFFGVSVFWGLQLVLAVAAAWLVRGNRAVAAAMTLVSNPLTTVPLYGLCWAVGRALLGGGAPLPDLAELRSLEVLLALGPRLVATLLAGTTAVGLAGALALYLGAGRLRAAARRWRGLGGAA